MDVKEQIKLNFKGVDIFNVKFSSETPLIKGVDIHLDISPKVFYPNDSSLDFKIIFEVTLTAKEYFELKLKAVGHFSFEKNIEDAVKKSFVNANAPAIMFPYIRSFITTFSSNLGNATGAILLPPHFFSGQLEEIIQENIKSE